MTGVQTCALPIYNYTQAINFAGIIDNTFGSLGVAKKNISGYADGTRALAIQPDGKIVAVGNNNTPNFCFARYNQDGSLDKSFGPLGTSLIVTSNINGGAYSILLQADEKIVLIGTSTGIAPDLFDFVLARYINPFSLTSFTESYGSVGLI